MGNKLSSRIEIGKLKSSKESAGEDGSDDNPE